jgi:hypothetical protein
MCRSVVSVSLGKHGWRGLVVEWDELGWSFVVWGVSRCIGVLGAGIVPGIQIGEYSIVLHSMNEISAHKKLKLTVAALPRVDMARFPPAISSSDLIRRDTAPSPTPPHPPSSPT